MQAPPISLFQRSLVWSPCYSFIMSGWVGNQPRGAYWRKHAYGPFPFQHSNLSPYLSLSAITRDPTYLGICLLIRSDCSRSWRHPCLLPKFFHGVSRLFEVPFSWGSTNSN